MYLSALKVQSFRQFGAEPNGLFIEFNEGVTALVGENDAGKSSVIDAMRFVLQTRDGEYVRLQPTMSQSSPMLCSICQAALLAHPILCTSVLDLQSGLFRLTLPLPKPLNEVGIHQLINTQIKTAIHERC